MAPIILDQAYSLYKKKKKGILNMLFWIRRGITFFFVIRFTKPVPLLLHIQVLIAIKG